MIARWFFLCGLGYTHLDCFVESLLCPSNPFRILLSEAANDCPTTVFVSSKEKYDRHLTQSPLYLTSLWLLVYNRKCRSAMVNSSCCGGFRKEGALVAVGSLHTPSVLVLHHHQPSFLLDNNTSRDSQVTQSDPLAHKHKSVYSHNQTALSSQKGRAPFIPLCPSRTPLRIISYHGANPAGRGCEAGYSRSCGSCRKCIW